MSDQRTYKEIEIKQTDRTYTTVALLLAVFLAAVEGTAVSTVMPTIAGELGGVTLYAWVFAIYMFGSSVTVPLFGKLGDQYGRKPVFMFGMVVFIVGSALCGLAASIEQLILCRGIQGLGAGAVQPMAITIIGDIFSIKERPRVQAAFGSVWGISGVLGPLFGGLFVEYSDWRWVFFINIPIGLASLLVISYTYHESITRMNHKIDIKGFLFLATASLCLMLAGESDEAALMYALTILSLALFYYSEKTAAEPIWPIALFSQRLMVIASLVGICMGSQLYALVTFLPLYHQAVLGSGPTEAGFSITSVIVAWPIAAYISGRLLQKVGFRPLFVFGASLICVGTLGISVFVSAKSSSPLMYLANFLIGSGFGCLNAALVTSVQYAVAWNQRGVATASTMFCRTLGGTIAVALMGTKLKSSLLSDKTLSETVVNAILNPHLLSQIDAEQMRHVAGAMEYGLSQIFLIVFMTALIGLGLSLFFPHTPVPTEDHASVKHAA